MSGTRPLPQPDTIAEALDCLQVLRDWPLRYFGHSIPEPQAFNLFVLLAGQPLAGYEWEGKAGSQ